MKSRGLFYALGITALIIAVIAVAYHRPYLRGANIHPADASPDLSPYAQEFARCFEVTGHGETVFQGGSAVSPDRRLRLVGRPLRNYYHEIMISETEGGGMRRVLILQESDPGSGTSHDTRWSQDGKVVFIQGAGSPAGHAHTHDLALIYHIEQGALYSVDLRPLLEAAGKGSRGR